MSTPRRTVNAWVRDQTIRHQALLERYKAHEIVRALRFLAHDMLSDVEARLRSRLDRIRLRGYDSGPWTTGRYRDMVLAIREQVAVGLQVLSRQVTESMDLLAVHEADWAAALMRDGLRQAAVTVETLFPSSATLRQIVREPVFDAKLDDWFRAIGRTTTNAIERQVTRGLALGESTDQMVRRVVGRVGRNEGVAAMTRAQSATVVRTAVNHVSARVREETAAANTDIVKSMQWVSTLDARTSPICQSYDGHVWDVGKGPRPPAHPNCRSTMVMVLEAFPVVPEETRASADGQVPGSTTYGEWLKTRSREEQNAILGPGKADVFRRGVVPFDRFVVNQKPLSLKDLRALELTLR